MVTTVSHAGPGSNEALGPWSPWSPWVECGKHKQDTYDPPGQVGHGGTD